VHTVSSATLDCGGNLPTLAMFLSEHTTCCTMCTCLQNCTMFDINVNTNADCPPSRLQARWRRRSSTRSPMCSRWRLGGGAPPAAAPPAAGGQPERNALSPSQAALAADRS